MDGSFDSNDKRWRSGVFRPNYSRLFSVFLSVVVIGGISVVIVINRGDVFSPPLRWENLWVLFPAFALLAFVFFLKAVLAGWKFRSSRFTMDTMPGVIGGKFTGMLVLPDLFDNDSKVRLEIVNEKRIKRRSGRNNRESIERFYSDFASVNVSQFQTDGRSVSIPVEFTIPYSTKDETDSGSESSKRGGVKVKYRWLLKAKSVIHGADLDVVFEVPVYRTAESDPEILEPVKDFDELKSDMAAAGGPQRVEVYQEYGVKHFVTKGMPRLSTICMLLIYTGLFFWTGVSLMRMGIRESHGDAHGVADNIYKGIRTYLPMLGSAITFLWGLFMGFLLLRSLSRKETWVDFGHLHHSGRFLMYSWKKKIELGRIEDVVFEKSGHGEDIDIYRVVVKHIVDLPKFATNQRMRNRKLCIADEITSKTEAKWLKEQLLEAVFEKA